MIRCPFQLDQNTLCDPDSKLGVLRWLERVVIPGVASEGLTHQQLLRAMDVLAARRDRVREAIGARLCPLLDADLALVFYDLTTIRIHGEAELDTDLRCYGRSKELKGSARRCVLGLIQTGEGLPLDVELFEGNVAEVKTLLPMLRRCLARYPIRRVVVVADRGLLSLDNVGELEQLRLQDARPLEYILAVPAARYGEFADAIRALSFPNDAPSLRETRVEGRRVVIAHDPDTAAERGQRRRAKLDELIWTSAWRASSTPGMRGAAHGDAAPVIVAPMRASPGPCWRPSSVAFFRPNSRPSASASASMTRPCNGPRASTAS